MMANIDFLTYLLKRQPVIACNRLLEWAFSLLRSFFIFFRVHDYVCYVCWISKGTWLSKIEGHHCPKYRSLMILVYWFLLDPVPSLKQVDSLKKQLEKSKVCYHYKILKVTKEYIKNLLRSWGCETLDRADNDNMLMVGDISILLQ